MYIMNMNKFICFIVVLLLVACVEKDNGSITKEVSCRFFSLDIPREYSFEDITEDMVDWKHFIVKDERGSAILDVYESSIPNGSRNGDVYSDFNSSFQLIDTHVSVDGLYGDGGPAVYSVLYGRYSESGISSFIHFVYLANNSKKTSINRIIRSLKNPSKPEINKIDASLSPCKRVENVLPLGYSVAIDDLNSTCRIKNSRGDDVAWILDSSFVNPPDFKPLPDSLLSSTFEMVDYFKSREKRQLPSTEIKYSEIYGKLNKKRTPVFFQFMYTDFMKKSGQADLIRKAVVGE